MKFLLICLLFVSCAKDINQDKPNGDPQIPGLFTNTGVQSEEALRENATILLRLGKSISAEQAKKCVIAETNRPGIQQVCVLLWAQRQEENPFLEEILLEKARNSREWAIALFVNRVALKNLSADHLLTALQQIGSEPLPFFVNGLEFWQAHQKSRTEQDLKRIWEFVRLRYQEQPERITSYLRLTWLFDRSQFRKELQRFCNPNHIQKAKWHCWKSLQFIEQDKTLLPELKITFRQLYPSQWNDPEWRQFRSYFPKTANVTQKSLEEK